jgi:hypothetical protein
MIGWTIAVGGCMSARCFLVVIVAALSLGTVVIDAGGWVVITL